MMMFYKNSLQGAITNPLCAEYRNEWRKCGDDKAKLVKLALRQQSTPYVISYFNAGKGLSKEYLLEEFKDYINGASVVHDADLVEGYTYALNVDLQKDWTITTDVCTFLWCYDVVAVVKATSCPTLYVGCNSQVNLALDGYNSIRVYLFDNSTVRIEDADEDSSVIVYKYSKEARVDIDKYCLANVKVFDKELRL